MSSEGLDALTRPDIPELARPINRAGQTVVTGEVKLTAGKFTRMPFQSKQALARADVPNFGGVIETTCEELISVCVEMQRHDFSLVTGQSEDLLTGLNIPKLGRVVHGPCCNQHAVGVEREAHNFHLVALERVVALSCSGIPNLCLFVKGPSHNFVTKGIIEGHAVDDVRVFVKRKQLLARISVPHLTGPIVGARDELVTILVERAVCKRQQVGAQNLEQREFLFLVFLLLLDKFFDQLF